MQKNLGIFGVSRNTILIFFKIHTFYILQILSPLNNFFSCIITVLFRKSLDLNIVTACSVSTF